VAGACVVNDSNFASDSSTSVSLLDRVKDCEQDAWVRLVELYSPLIYLWCRQAGLQAADAADVRQDVFRAVARKIGDFRHDRPGDTFRGWLRTITRNRIRDFFSSARAAAGRGAGAGGSEALLNLQQVAQSPEKNETDADVSTRDEQSESRLLYRRAVELIRREFEERTWLAFWRVVV